MRSCVGIFGLLCGLIVIGLVARYGYKTTEGAIDAYIAAFIYGAVTAGGLFLHAVATRLWRIAKPLSVFCGVVSVGALLLSLSNTLGAIAIRCETETTKRIAHNRKVDAAEGERDRLDGQRKAMPDFVFTDAAAAEAARLASETAIANQKAECADKRGPKCGSRELETAAAANALKMTADNKALTDRAKQLETDAQAERDKLTALGPKLTVNQQGSAMARLLRLPDTEADFAATAQQFGMAAFVELIIIVCMMAWETMGREKAQMRAIARARVEALPVMTAVTPPGRKLLAAPERPSQQVMRIMTDALTPAPGMSVALDSGYRRYAAICAAEGIEPVLPETYLDAMVEFCRAVGLATRSRKGRVLLVNVALAEPVEAASPA